MKKYCKCLIVFCEAKDYDEVFEYIIDRVDHVEARISRFMIDLMRTQLSIMSET